jgi:hypothetical protein
MPKLSLPSPGFELGQNNIPTKGHQQPVAKSMTNKITGMTGAHQLIDECT